MKYKLLACDLDGTLLDDNSNVSAENLNAIDEMVKLGVEFAICTGRTYDEIPKALLDNKSIRYIIYSDGSVILDKNKKKNIFEHYIDEITNKKLFELLSNYDTMIEFFDFGTPKTEKSKLNLKSYDYYKIDKYYIETIENTRLGIDSLKNELPNLNHTELINVFFSDLDERKKCYDILNSFETINFTTSMDNNIEIMAKGVSKGDALFNLCKLIGVSKNETIAVGDSLNDLTMFELASLPIASGNASKKIKEITKNVACSNNEPIVKYILENFIK